MHTQPATLTLLLFACEEVYRGFAPSFEGLLDGSSDERPIEETRTARSRHVFDDEPVHAAIARGCKVAFMATIGQPSLPAYVRDACVVLERFQFHIQGVLVIEQLDHDCCSITGVAPACRCGVFDTNEIGRILRPVLQVCDLDKCLRDGDIKGVSHLDAQHENVVLSFEGAYGLLIVGCRLLLIDRSLLLLDPYRSLAVRLTKTIRIGGNRRIDLLVEGFNLTNHANFRPPLGSQIEAGVSLNTACALVRTAVRDARQIQWGLRYGF